MTKVKTKPGTKESGSAKFNLSDIIPEKYQTIAAFAVIILLFLFFFNPMYFGGKTFQSGDIVTSKSLQTYLDKDREGFSLWFPYSFCGMPAYALATEYKWFNLLYVGIRSLRDVSTSFFSVEYSMWTFYLLILSITSYFLIHHLTKNRLISLFGAISTSFSTGILLLLFIGHVTKLTTLCFYPLIFLILLKFRDKIKLRDFAILIIALQLALQGWHVQIIFYTLLAVGLYFLYGFISALVKKEKTLQIQYLKSVGVFSVAFIIALLIQSDNLTQIYEYNDYSTRGTKGILETQTSQDNKSGGSDFYDYATRWSFSPGEIMNFIVPSFYGFGKSSYKGPETQGQEIELNTYFGQKESEDVAPYMGVIVFFLAVFSMYSNRKNPFVQFIIALVIISLLISFGKNFPAAYNLMYYYFPFFDKFRVPSMILVLLQMSFPVLAALGLKKIYDAFKENDLRINKIVQYAAFGLTGIFVLSLLLSSTIGTWFSTRLTESGKVNEYIQYYSQYGIDVAGIAKGMFTSDVLVSFALSAIVFWLIYAFLNRKMSFDLLIIGVIVLSSFDLIRIAARGETFTDNKGIETAFNKPDYIAYIDGLKDKEPYRLLNLKQDGSLGSVSNDGNFNAYFLEQDFHGYSSIKPRAYQDYMDVVGVANATMWRMLNVKYIITEKAIEFPGLELLNNTEKTFVYKFTNVLPRAYFVNKVENKKPLDILNAVKADEFDPKDIAYVENSNLKIDTPDSTANVTIAKYDDEKIELNVNASGKNFLFLGDTYFPKGWKAFIDGAETEIYRANHGFRGIVVPKGNRKVEFVYNPKSFVISKYLALSLSSLTLLGLILGIFFDYRKSRTA
ncbi:MAG: YfhO family protein [bacterium]